MNELEIWVAGIPAPQGSKRHVGGGRMVESSKKVKPWRAGVVQAARDAAALTAGFTPFDGPVRVDVTFYMPRPQRHYIGGHVDGELKADAPLWVSSRPDVDKLLRSTFDGLSTAGVWADDNLAARVTVSKQYAKRPDLAGALVHLRPLARTP